MTRISPEVYFELWFSGTLIHVTIKSPMDHADDIITKYDHVSIWYLCRFQLSEIRDK